MFFNEIHKMMSAGIDLNLTIRQQDGKMVVSTFPKANGLKDEAQNHIQPIIVSGTPEELDSGFLSAISQPIQKASGLLVNMKQFEESANAAAANSKAEKEKKDKEAKEVKERKEKYDKLLKKADELEKEKKYQEAIPYLRQAKTFASSAAVKTVDDKIASLTLLCGQGSLFDSAPAIDPTFFHEEPEEESAEPGEEYPDDPDEEEYIPNAEEE